MSFTYGTGPFGDEDGCVEFDGSARARLSAGTALPDDFSVSILFSVPDMDGWERGDGLTLLCGSGAPGTSKSVLSFDETVSPDGGEGGTTFFRFRPFSVFDNTDPDTEEILDSRFSFVLFSDKDPLTPVAANFFVVDYDGTPGTRIVDAEDGRRWFFLTLSVSRSGGTTTIVPYLDDYDVVGEAYTVAKVGSESLGGLLLADGADGEYLSCRVAVTWMHGIPLTRDQHLAAFTDLRDNEGASLLPPAEG